MKITCNYCDKEFETEGVTSCPFCGAPFTNNESYLKAKKNSEEKLEMNRESDRIELERRKISLEMKKVEAENEKSIKNINKAMRIGCLVPILIIIAVITVSVICSIMKSNNNDNSTDTDNKVTSPVTEKENPVTALFNKEAVTEKYTVMCDKAQEVSRYPFDTTKGYKCVSFHIVVQNTTDTKLKLDNSVVCSANGYQCNDVWTNGQKLLSSVIESGMKDDGYVWFEIPENAETVKLTYNGLVTVTISSDDITPMK